jgi:DNA-binding transcriptional MerR regulator
MAASQKTYSISELAREFSISTRTIRFYEEKGFINPLREGQRRVYSAADRARIRLILRGKRIGFSLAESMEIIDMYDPDHSDAAQIDSLLARIAERRETLQQQRRDLEEMLVALDEVEALCQSERQQHHQQSANSARTHDHHKERSA